MLHVRMRNLKNPLGTIFAACRSTGHALKIKCICFRRQFFVEPVSVSAVVSSLRHLFFSPEDSIATMASGGKLSTMKAFGMLSKATNVAQIFRDYHVQLTPALIEKMTTNFEAIAIAQFPVAVSNTHNVADSFRDPKWRLIKTKVQGEILSAIRHEIQTKGEDPDCFRVDSASFIADKIVADLRTTHDGENPIEKLIRTRVSERICINLRMNHRCEGAAEMIDLDLQGTITKSTRVLSSNEINMSFEVNLRIISLNLDMASQALTDQMVEPYAMLNKVKFR